MKLGLTILLILLMKSRVGVLAQSVPQIIPGGASAGWTDWGGGAAPSDGHTMSRGPGPIPFGRQVRPAVELDRPCYCCLSDMQVSDGRGVGPPHCTHSQAALVGLEPMGLVGRAHSGALKCATRTNPFPLDSDTQWGGDGHWGAGAPRRAEHRAAGGGVHEPPGLLPAAGQHGDEGGQLRAEGAAPVLDLLLHEHPLPRPGPGVRPGPPHPTCMCHFHLSQFIGCRTKAHLRICLAIKSGFFLCACHSVVSPFDQIQTPRWTPSGITPGMEDPPPPL